MKWALRCSVLLMILCGALFWTCPTQVSAATSQYVTITARPNTGIIAPYGLVLTRLDANTVRADWTNLGSGNITILVADSEDYPTNYAGIVPAFVGTGNTCNITWPVDNMEIYVSAWSSDNGTIYSASYTTAMTGGFNMLLIAFILIPLGLIVAMFVTRERMLGFPSGIFWAVLGGYCYTKSTATWDIYYFMFFASVCMAIFAFYAQYALREKPDAIGDMEIEHGDGGYIDESNGHKTEVKQENWANRRINGIRERAKRRRYSERNN